MVELMIIKKDKKIQKMIYKSIGKVNIISELSLKLTKKSMKNHFHHNMKSMKLLNQNSNTQN